MDNNSIPKTTINKANGDAEIRAVLDKLNNKQLKDIIINRLSNEEIMKKYQNEIKGI